MQSRSSPSNKEQLLGFICMCGTMVMRSRRAGLGGAPARIKIPEALLLVVADATVEVAHFCNETHLGNRFRITRTREHVAHFSDRALRLLSCSKHLLSICLAGGVFQFSSVFPEVWFGVRVRNGKKFPIAHVRTERIEVTVEKSAFSLVEHIERFGFIRFHSGNR